MVGINVPIPVPVSFYSFGGWKASLFGDAPIYGPEGVRFYTRPKVVTTRWPEATESAIDLGFPSTCDRRRQREADGSGAGRRPARTASATRPIAQVRVSMAWSLLICQSTARRS